MAGFDKIVVVTKKTALEELIERFNTRDQARFYIEHLGASFQEYQEAHDTYQQRPGDAQGRSPGRPAPAVHRARPSCRRSCLARMIWWSRSAPTGWWSTRPSTSKPSP